MPEPLSKDELDQLLALLGVYYKEAMLCEGAIAAIILFLEGSGRFPR
ncbi:MAG TPA: hypothetical protein VE860_27615 [Chthoniobacterales bacterium]|nr:hypothetical protein [Chthoniobacterales bacterium]